MYFDGVFEPISCTPYALSMLHPYTIHTLRCCETLPKGDRHCEERSSLLVKERTLIIRLLRHKALHKAHFTRNDGRFSGSLFEERHSLSIVTARNEAVYSLRSVSLE